MSDPLPEKCICVSPFHGADRGCPLCDGYGNKLPEGERRRPTAPSDVARAHAWVPILGPDDNRYACSVCGQKAEEPKSTPCLGPSDPAKRARELCDAVRARDAATLSEFIGVTVAPDRLGETLYDLTKEWLASPRAKLFLHFAFRSSEALAFLGRIPEVYNPAPGEFSGPVLSLPTPPVEGNQYDPQWRAGHDYAIATLATHDKRKADSAPHELRLQEALARHPEAVCGRNLFACAADLIERLEAELAEAKAEVAELACALNRSACDC